jgi:hypothetical protein
LGGELALAVGKIASRDADNQRILRDLDPHVLQGPPAASLSCRYGEFEATIDIGTLAVMEGELPGRALKLVQEWAMIHREELSEDWRLCRAQAPPANIEPLP